MKYVIPIILFLALATVVYAVAISAEVKQNPCNECMLGCKDLCK